MNFDEKKDIEPALSGNIGHFFDGEDSFQDGNDSVFDFEIREGRDHRFIEITKYHGQGSYVAIPPKIEGMPVESIGAFAFAGAGALSEVTIPESVRTVRLFAFQNCVRLRRITLTNQTTDLYDGVIRGCTGLREIAVHIVKENDFTIVKDLLRDTDGELAFVLYFDGQKEAPAACLTFPEYVNEAREDYEARAIHITIEGAGVSYRECVTKKSVDFAGYDKLFERLTDVDFKVAVRIAMGRLRYPAYLEEAGKDRYEKFILDHLERVLLQLLAEPEEEGLSCLLHITKMLEERRKQGKCLEEQSIQSAITHALKEASDAQRTEVCAVLMEALRAVPSKTPTRRKRTVLTL